MARILAVEGERRFDLNKGWRVLATAADAAETPEAAAALPGWIPAQVPGTLAGALREAGAAIPLDGALDQMDAWFSTTLEAKGAHTLEFDGVATFAEVWLEGRPIAQSPSMFAPFAVEVELKGGERLDLRCRALAPQLANLRRRGRWRTQLITPPALRHVRTTALGRMPGCCPEIPPVGPWRPVRLVARGPLGARDLRVRSGWRDGKGQLEVSLDLDGVEHDVALHCGGVSAAMVEQAGCWRARLEIPTPPWWPHTHGDQPLHRLEVVADGRRIDLGRVGFRELALDRGADGRGFGLLVNDTPVFCRGANWLPPDLIGLSATRAALEPNLRLARDAGMNMLRVSGIGVYPSAELIELCDELGLLLWQDFMFANFDYPSDEAFLALCRAEAEFLLSQAQGSPALAVLSGGSEIAQQAAMLGLDPAVADLPLTGETLARLSAEQAPGALYVRGSPDGGALPFQPDTGVSHYFGVGAYLRGLDDARRAQVRFAAECLAFSHPPESAKLAPDPYDTPAWKAAVPRDRGVSWDFEDVREHYLASLCGVDPLRLRREDPQLWLDLSRCVPAELVAATFDEWRRPASPCAGALVWTFNDLVSGAGWGVIDAEGRPKLAWWALKRAFRPVQLAITDEGLNGLDLHLLNETAEAIEAELTLEVWDAEGRAMLSVESPVDLAARSDRTLRASELVGRFFDFTYAYKFGPCAHAMTRARLTRRSDGAELAEAFHFPDRGELRERAPLSAELTQMADGAWALALACARPLRRVLIEDEAFLPEDNGFPLAPGTARTLRLSRRPGAPAEARPRGEARTPGGYARATWRVA